MIIVVRVDLFDEPAKCELESRTKVSVSSIKTKISRVCCIVPFQYVFLSVFVYLILKQQ